MFSSNELKSPTDQCQCMQPWILASMYIALLNEIGFGHLKDIIIRTAGEMPAGGHTE